MSEDPHGNIPAGDGTYIEEVVEYVDNGRQRIVLVTALALLLILLVGLTLYVLRLSRPTTAPTNAQVPRGITWVRSIYGWGQRPEQQLQAPTDVAIGPDGTIWCLSQHRYVVAFAPDGSPKRALDPKVGVSLEGLSVAEDGDLFIADFGGQVIQLHPDGSVVATWAVQLPNEVDVRDGKIAVAAAKGVAVFTPDDQVLAKFGTRGQGADQFDLPHGILQTADRIYVSDTQNQRLRAYTAGGRPVWTLGKAPDRTKRDAGDFRSATNTSAPFELPAGMTMDGAGRLVVVDAFKFQVVAVDAQKGTVVRDAQKRLARYGDQGSADGLFMYPTGIAYDKARDWFVVADTGNNRLQVIRIPGSGGSATARAASAFTLPMLVFLLPLLVLVVPPASSIVRRRRALAEQLTATEPGPV